MEDSNFFLEDYAVITSEVEEPITRLKHAGAETSILFVVELWKPLFHKDFFLCVHDLDCDFKPHEHATLRLKAR